MDCGREFWETTSVAEEFKAQAEVEEQNKEIVRRYIEEEDKGNLLEIFDKIAAPDVIYHYPNNNVSGLETIKQSSPQFHKAFPDLKYTIEFLIAEGDLVTTRYNWRGTHKGRWWGVEPTGKELAFTVLDVCRVKDGKIVEAWIEFDSLALMQQLGMELRPKEEKK